MTDKEILQKAMNKAHNRGYSNMDGSKFSIDVWKLEDLMLYTGEYDEYREWSVRDIIFSHDFAQAFWGLEMFGDDGFSFYITKKAWIYHLEKLVILPDVSKLKYLEKFL